MAQGGYLIAARQAPPKKQRGRTEQAQLPADERAALNEAEELAAMLGVPVTDAVQILADDRESYISPPIATATDWARPSAAAYKPSAMAVLRGGHGSGGGWWVVAMAAGLQCVAVD